MNIIQKYGKITSTAPDSLTTLLTFDTKGRIRRTSGGSWISARDNTIIMQEQTNNSGSSYNPIIGTKTQAGFWSMGSCGGETLYLSYDTDENYNTGNNTSSTILFPTAGRTGTIALTSDIPTSLPASDVYAWAKKSTKPSYKTSEVTEETNLYFTNQRAIDACSGTYLTGITKAMVTNALGYTPYNSTNPNEYITASGSCASATYASRLGDSSAYHTKATIDTAIAGKWTWNAADVAGVKVNNAVYADSAGSAPASDVYDWAKKSSLALEDVPDLSSKYLPLSGGTLTGEVQFNITGLAKSDICTGVIAAFKAPRIQATDLICNTITLGAASGSSSNLPLTIRKYSKVTNKNPDGITNLVNISTDGVVDISSSLRTRNFLRIDTTDYAGNYGYLKPETYVASGNTNRAVLRIGSNYGGNTNISLGAEALDAINIYRGVVGIGGTFSGDTLYQQQKNGISLAVNGNMTVNGNLVSLDGHTHTSFTSAVSFAAGLSSSANVTVTGKVSASSGFYEESDERLKSFKDPIKVDLEKLSKLRKSYFTFNNDPDNLQIGVSAQEVQSLYPELVAENENGNLTVAYDKLSVIALAAVDQLSTELNTLKDELQQIKAHLNLI